MKFDPNNLFDAARAEVARDDAAFIAGRQLGKTRMHNHIMGTRAANAYMKARGIGKSAVDLIPREIRQPHGPVPKDDTLFWTHTPGILKLTAWFVRLAWRQP